MSPERWQEISKIFNLALEKKPEERKSFLDEACSDEPSFRREIEALLAAGDERDSFIDSPNIGLRATMNESRLQPDDQIGSFRIVRLLGSGGMGAVYLARDLRLNRNVALKFLSLADENSNRRFLREARSAAALEHPHICTIHEIAEDAGREFIVMQYVEGEPLSAKIKRGPLKIREALEIAIQIADALTQAHEQGIVHRDIKPANIIISPNNQAKILDFGLAKKIVFDSTDSESSFKTLLSAPGMILGTVSYMSPEQIRGKEVDHRSDLWSVGVVLYEMVTGAVPFQGENTVEKLAAILYQEPPRKITDSAQLNSILEKALQKEPRSRYRSAGELLDALRQLKEEMDFEKQLLVHVTNASGEKDLTGKISQFLADHSSLETSVPPGMHGARRNFRWGTAAFVVVTVLAAAVGGYYWWKNFRLGQARENLRKAERLAAADQTFEAYDLAVEAEKLVPDDKTLAAILPAISDNLSVDSQPSGAKVYLRRFAKNADGKFAVRELIGETPIDNLRIARGQYILQIEKEGFAPFERTISGVIPRVGDSFIASPPLTVRTGLVAKEKVPDRMVYVPDGEYSLVNWSRPTEKRVQLSAFLIDKYEVTNAEYKEFIMAGGYSRVNLWKYQFIKNGKPISVAEALGHFKDRTGLPAPRGWSNQTYPEGKADFPVTDISWYEAAAYAEFRGKQLPTVFQWEKAARDGAFDPRYNALPWGFIKQGETTDNRANFRGSDTAPVESNEFGMSPYGAFNMAGNVSEWNLNASPDGFVTSGGAWNDLAYSFGNYGEYPGLYASNRIGFRCVLNLGDGNSDEGRQMLPAAETPEYKPSSPADLKLWLTHYEYDKRTLDAVILQSVETADWRREKIGFTGEGGEQVIAYLYLPKNSPLPLQILHYIPPGDVVRGIRSLPDSIEMFASPLIKSGRAVFGVVLKGYIERPFPDHYTPPDNSSVAFRKQMVDSITDLRRGIDYLESRPELDKQNLGFLGISNGANLGLVLTAVETRYKSIAFIGAGLEKDFRSRIAETNPINFSSQIKTQKLVINGRYDETFPYNTDAKPLFGLLPEPKKIVMYEGGHIPTTEFYVPAVNGWFDETMGPVIR